VEIKLGEQRRFVLWWDEAKHGGDPRKGRPNSHVSEWLF
jgi:hypothetical protein